MNVKKIYFWSELMDVNLAKNDNDYIENTFNTIFSFSYSEGVHLCSDIPCQCAQH